MQLDSSTYMSNAMSISLSTKRYDGFKHIKQVSALQQYQTTYNTTCANACLNYTFYSKGCILPAVE